MLRMPLLLSLVPLMLGVHPCLGVQGALDSPEAAVQTYIDGLKRGDLSAVRRAYNLAVVGSDFHLSGPLPIESYRITKKLVLDSVAAARHNEEGIVPPARVADVELQVEEMIEGKREMYSYWLRVFDGHWRIYAHTAWGGPD